MLIGVYAVDSYELNGQSDITIRPSQISSTESNCRTSYRPRPPRLARASSYVSCNVWSHASFGLDCEVLLISRAAKKSLSRVRELMENCFY